ncbi:RTC4-like domain-containing protein [Collybia nuda]|uniref:Restriction of telomere capping protein 4 n=1 Tax=Collybia nuda TaxID=64659 RepID=A0A9P5Y3C2_9AGAR|nr:RTC4-like domain-containing protein [Collybia nuda]
MDRFTSRWNERGAFEDEGNRMKTRPTVEEELENKNKGIRRKGQAVEDLGSGFIKKGAIGRNRRGAPSKRSQTSTPYDLTDSEPDELDTLSQHSAAEASSKEDLLLGPDGKIHKAHPDFPSSRTGVYKSLKFKKTKPSHDNASASHQSDTPLSVFPILQENANVQRPNGETMPKSLAKPQHTASQASTSRPRSPPVHPRPKLPSSRTLKPAQEAAKSENTRPKPRPIGKPRVASAQLQPAPFPSLDPPSSPRRRRNTVSTTENDDTRSTKSTLTPAPFPMVSPASSPLHPAKFPTLPPLGSQGSKQKSKPFMPQSLVKERASQAKPVEMSKATKPKVPNDYPTMSPLSSQTRTLSSSQKSSTAKKGPSKKRIVSEEESEVEINSVLKPQPFPMSTQVLGSIGSPCTPPVAGPSRPGKRSSSDRNSSGGGRENKKTKKDDDMCAEAVSSILLSSGDYDYEEDDTVCMSPTRDPKTLCPYCDAPLPRFPTPLLTRLLASTALKSKPQARPGNPMGRKAPFTTFITVCQRHRFETKILPEAEAKGWPKSIEWANLEARVSRMKGVLQDLIQDPVFEPGSDDDEFPDDEKAQGSKARCVFWKEVINEVKQKGSRAVAGVQGQFANFEKTQPGYYGERGSVIIHQTLYNLFPPTSIDPSHVAPLTPNEFLQRILVPEVGVRLIMEDKGLFGNDGVNSAVQILRDSASYGVAMFPEDGGEWGKGEGDRGSDGDNEELGVADLILMQRAKKRRKELEEEDEREEKEWQLLREGQKEKQKSLKKKEIEKTKKERGKKARSHTDYASHTPPIPRPRPRPLGKGLYGIDIFADEMDGSGSSQSRDASKETTDDESEDTLHSKSKRRFRLSPTVGGSCLKTNEKISTRRVTRSVSRSASVDVDLCSSSDNPSHSDASLKARPRNANKKHNRATRKATAHSSRSGGSDSDLVIVNSTPSSRKTPTARRSNHDRQSGIDVDDTPMPPSRPRFPPSRSEGKPDTQYPLRMAMERKKERCARDTVE